MLIAKIVNFFLDLFLPKKTSKGVRQFFSYLVCGGISTITDMAALYVLTHFLSLNHLIAAPISFIAGVATNYSLNTILVFQSSGKVKKEFPIFVLIGIGGLLWTEVILWILVDHLNFKVMIAKIVAVILVLNWNFFMRKKLVFPAESNLESLEKSLQEL